MSVSGHTVFTNNVKTVQHVDSWEKVGKRMKCPYLSIASSKECVKMLEQNMDEKLSDFDLKHFCDGNPVYCYYFRLPQLELKRAASPTEGQSHKTAHEEKIVQWKDWSPTKRLARDILPTRDRFPTLPK